MSQRVRLEWFEHTAQLVLGGLDRSAIERDLQTLLQDRLSVGGSAVRGNREKVITILLRTWVDVDQDLEPLRLDGLELIRSLPVVQHVIIHWGMLMAAYPFWGVVAEAVGRLLRLQGTVGAAEVQRRVRELRGERDTVARAARRVLRAFNDWGVLLDSPRKGTYQAAAPLPIDEKRLAAFLMEAWLRCTDARSAPLTSLAASPVFFPFVIDEGALSRLGDNPRIEITHHTGLGQVVMLK